MQITKNKVATIDYTLMGEHGNVLDSSENHGPMVYLHGVGGIIPGLESALEGKRAGETLKVTIPPEQAYGQKDPSLVHPVPRKNFTGVDAIKVGMQFYAGGQGGNRIVTVVGVDDETVTVDANHPLAGQTITCNVTILDVRDATEEEVQHAHVCYGDGNCQQHCGGGQ